MKQKDFDAKVYQLTQGAPINPFGFCKMNWKERRQILMSMIAIDDAEILKKSGRKNNRHRREFVFTDKPQYRVTTRFLYHAGNLPSETKIISLPFKYRKTVSFCKLPVLSFRPGKCKITSF